MGCLPDSVTTKHRPAAPYARRKGEPSHHAAFAALSFRRAQRSPDDHTSAPHVNVAPRGVWRFLVSRQPIQAGPDFGSKGIRQRQNYCALAFRRSEIVVFPAQLLVSRIVLRGPVRMPNEMLQDVRGPTDRRANALEYFRHARHVDPVGDFERGQLGVL